MMELYTRLASSMLEMTSKSLMMVFSCLLATATTLYPMNIASSAVSPRPRTVLCTDTSSSRGKLDRIKTSRATLMSWESGCLSNFISYQGYITTSSAVGAAAWAPLNNPADHPMNQGREGGGSGFSLFRGSGGESGDGGSLRGSANDGFGSNNVIKRGSGSSGSGGSAFGGSGQALGGRIGGGGSTLTGRGPARHDAEAARAARLAALEARGTGGAEGQESALADAEMGRVAARASDMDESLEVLQEMGFSAAEARLALERCDGDVEAAVSQLSAK